MSLNETPGGDRVRVVFLGLRNAGKSSLVNRVAGQALALVSDVPGTTTDPVKKAMELLPAGPVLLVDTAGLDDEGALGEIRVEQTIREMNRADVAVVVANAVIGVTALEKTLIADLKARGIPTLCALNRIDAAPGASYPGFLPVSAKTGEGVEAFKAALAELAAGEAKEKPIASDLLRPGDVALLVTPIDGSAPKGRMILPQMQTLRDLLDAGAMALTCRDTELSGALSRLSAPPALVITDSQVFGQVAKIVPETVPLTSFSILFARKKGFLEAAVAGARALDDLKDGARVLISEGCTHRRQCADIGTVKMPGWLSEYTGKRLNFAFTSGGEFPESLSGCALVLHCGACMLGEKEMRCRMREAARQGVPFTNYGVAIAKMRGILPRALSPLPGVRALLNP